MLYCSSCAISPAVVKLSPPKTVLPSSNQTTKIPPQIQKARNNPLLHFCSRLFISLSSVSSPKAASSAAITCTMVRIIEGTRNLLK